MPVAARTTGTGAYQKCFQKHLQGRKTRFSSSVRQKVRPLVCYALYTVSVQSWDGGRVRIARCSVIWLIARRSPRSLYEQILDAGFSDSIVGMQEARCKLRGRKIRMGRKQIYSQRFYRLVHNSPR
jgi:hypothetical protein